MNVVRLPFFVFRRSIQVEGYKVESLKSRCSSFVYRCSFQSYWVIRFGVWSLFQSFGCL